MRKQNLKNRIYAFAGKVFSCLVGVWLLLMIIGGALFFTELIYPDDMKAQLIAIACSFLPVGGLKHLLG